MTQRVPVRDELAEVHVLRTLAAIAGRAVRA